MYDEAVQFLYLKSFARVQVICSTREQAELAQDNLKNLQFQGQSLTVRPIKVKEKLYEKETSFHVNILKSHF